jgi:hypothetical protein
VSNREIKKSEEFDIVVEDGSAAMPPPPEPPPAPRLILQVPPEFTWKVDLDSNRPGTKIEFFLKRGRT